MFNKFGTVGRILPGMEARLEKVEGVEEGGRLVVRGPNVMLGYLRAERPGVLERPPEGWYDTGDIVTIDAQGFVTIKGRAKRFAKIGGEMISLAAVEMLASELWPNALSAVVAVPDPRKGERLILVTQQKDASRSAFLAFARERGASELMIPSEIFNIDKMPLLGSGKVDMVSLNKLVREQVAEKSAVAGEIDPYRQHQVRVAPRGMRAGRGGKGGSRYIDAVVGAAQLCVPAADRRVPRLRGIDAVQPGQCTVAGVPVRAGWFSHLALPARVWACARRLPLRRHDGRGKRLS